ncbi:MAG: sulfotransferase, partial [Planctomycetota bacterium]
MSQANAPTVRPDFFLIGAAKSGTTSLANYLDSHPDVYLCKPKEPNFFAFPPNVEPSCQGPAPAEVLFDKLLRYSVTVPAEYDRLFKPATTGQQTGDASVRYLYEPSAAERIANHAPNAKAIAILREPVARMYSHYHMNVRNGFEPLTFEDALQAEDERVTSGWGWDWHYRRVGRYAKQLDRYFAALGRE